MRRPPWGVGAAACVLALGGTTAATAAPGDIHRLTHGFGGGNPNDASATPAIDHDGLNVAFQSDATNLSPDPDLNFFLDVFLRPLDDTFSTPVSLTDADGPANNNSGEPEIVETGNPPRVIFFSLAPLVPTDGNMVGDVYIRDPTGTTTDRVSLDSGGGDPNGGSSQPSANFDGSVVAFTTSAGDVVATPVDPGGFDVYQRSGGSNQLVSINAAGTAPGNNGSFNPAVADDSTAVASTVAFDSVASSLITSDTNDGDSDVFVRESGSTEVVSVNSDEEQDVDDGSSNPAISDDGETVAFISNGALAPGGEAGSRGVFVRDRAAGTTERIDLTLDGSLSEGNTLPGTELGAVDPPSISGDGRYVAFSSTEDSLVPNDTNGNQDVFVRDRQLGRTIRVNVPETGGQTALRSAAPAISGNGAVVAFASEDNGLVPGDTSAFSPGWEIFAVELDWSLPETNITSAPPATTTLSQVSVAFGSNKQGSSFECQVDSGGFAACASPFTTLPLAVGAHTVAIRATDRFGNREPEAASVGFTVTAQGVPPPEFRESFNAELVSGTVFVTLPDGRRVRLEDLLSIPAGSIIDARRGKMRLTVETKDGRLESALWSQGVFKPVQLANGLLECRLVGPLRNASAAASAGAWARDARRRRRLWGDGKGRFRTKGRYGSATVRGTKWLVEDRPKGTFFRVARGKVRIRDFTRKRSVVLKKGQTYFAPRRATGKRRG